jgi:hypothetical protein
MDADRFASFLRSFSTSPSRRTAFRMLAGSAFVGLLPLDTQPGQAKKGGKGKAESRGKKKKKKGGDACSCPAAPRQPTCPAVCPICQGCNPATGRCFGHPSQQGRFAPGCAAPRVCCGGSCCDGPIKACGGDGGCATCADVCPDNCAFCFHLSDGSTTCGEGFDGLGSSCELCTSNADCPPGAGEVCAISQTERSSNQTGPLCASQQQPGDAACIAPQPCS